MARQEQKDDWQEIKDIWKNQILTEEINILISKLVSEIKAKMSQFEKDSIKSDMIKVRSSWDQFKGKISQFEKDSIKSDMIKVRSSWDQFKGKVSQFEKDSIKKDVAKITSLLRKFLNKIRRKN